MEEEHATLDNYDLSDFINDKKTLLISDFEGTTPTAHFDKFKDYCTKEQVIFLGDVFDNTAQYGTKCDGDKCENPDDTTDKCPTDANYCALQTIKLLVDNPNNCRYVFGNRDINKIKLLPFFSFADGTKWWRGNSYEEIVKNLLATLDQNKDPWMIKEGDKKYFRPFWNKSKPDYTKRWLNDKKSIMSDLYTRFEWIFGSDPAVGTMSALVTLKCIPNEVMSSVTKTMLDFYKEVTKVPTKEVPEVPTKEVPEVPIKEVTIKDFSSDLRKKIRVALTLTIFMRMLDEELWEENKKDKPVGEFGALDGYLYHYLMNAPAAYHATSKDNLLLFAHGGITAQFIANGKEEIEKIKKYELGFEWEEILSGGGKCEKICRSIIYYNNTVKELLTYFFKTSNFKSSKVVLERLSEDVYTQEQGWKWRKPMLILLKLSAGDISPSNPESTVYYPNQVKQPSDQVLDHFKPEGIDKIYNIWGHASASSCYSFGKAREKSEKTRTRILQNDSTIIATINNLNTPSYNLLKTPSDNTVKTHVKIFIPEDYVGLNKVIPNTNTYFVSTDYSSTLFKQGLDCNDKYNKNFLILILDTTGDIMTLKLEGTIILGTKFTFIENNTNDINLIDSKQKVEDKKPKIMLPIITDPSGITINFDSNQNLIDIIDDDIDKKNINSKFIFNGIASIDGDETKYQVYSTIYSDDNKKPSMAFIPVLKKAPSPPAGGRRHRKTHRKYPRKTLKKNKKNKRNARKTKHKKARKTKRRL